MLIVTPSNNQEVLEQNLFKSKLVLDDNIKVKVLHNPTHITKEFNAILNEFPNELIMFVHNDVFIPDTFETQLEAALLQLPAHWSVLGVAGVDVRLCNKGHLNSQGDIWGSALSSIVPVMTVDELLFIVNNEYEIRFDERITNHHLFAADYCLQAIERGIPNFVGELFVHHNSSGSVPDANYDISASLISQKFHHLKPFGTTSRHFIK